MWILGGDFQEETFFFNIVSFSLFFFVSVLSRVLQRERERARESERERERERESERESERDVGIWSDERDQNMLSRSKS